MKIIHLSMAVLLFSGAAYPQMQDNKQNGAMPQHQGMAMPDHQQPGMQMPMPTNTNGASPMLLFASGTAWEPKQTPHSAWHLPPWHGWELMLHGDLFLAFDQETGPRGIGKISSSNFLMLMEQHRLSHGSLLLRGMFSAEPLTTPHGGFPELFQTGETYHGAPLVDRQHPHDVFGELSATYLLPLGENRLQWLAYGALSGEPALGPVAYIHRASAMDLPRAPLGHHLQDSTHISYGVLTSGLIAGSAGKVQLKLEASAFNGREPDERRYTMDFAPLDSWSARGSGRIGERWAVQYSFGRLVRPEAIEPGNVDRQTASVSYSRASGNHEWLNTILWGRNRKGFVTSPQNSYLLESLLHRRRNSVFTRLELVDKDELFPPEQTYPPTQSATTSALIGRQFRIGAYTFGASHSLKQDAHWDVALGADLTFYSMQQTLNPIYGADPVGWQVFLRGRPASMQMH